ncbi:hypothetical protein IFR05_004905 [Cadophora sp. M221]|nr:hypothetical protein IFR05_004905 [Cadophora sp. M221]
MELSESWFFYDTKDEHVGSDRSVHGFYDLSPGYALAHVPGDAVVRPVPTSTLGIRVIPKDPSSHEISTNYSFPKTFIAVVQLIFASYTLYDSFGSQIDTYGYGAFGLTVTPYALMSLINPVGGLVTPSYPSLFIVNSSIMDEAIERGSHFDGVFGTLHESKIPPGGGSAGGDFAEGVFLNDSQLRVHDIPPQSPLDDGNIDGEPQGQSIDIQPQNRDMEDAGDFKASLLFVSSSTCFERQKTHS